jgi:adenylate cyclase
MTEASIPAPESNPNEPIWRALLMGTDQRYARAHAWLRHLPGSPRCKMCSAPFSGVARPLMHFLGRDRWAKNPTYCGACFQLLSTMHGGAEIEATFLFADVRGSTAMAERISPTEFRRQLDRFYDASARIVVERDGIVDKFVGDEIVAMFIPALAHEAHARQAIEAGLAILEATGHGDPAGPWLPVGAGVHSGVAFVGAVGEPPVTELTALGDVVNTAARLASAADAGELLVSDAAIDAAGWPTADLEPRSLELKGKREPTSVRVARVPIAAIRP